MFSYVIPRNAGRHQWPCWSGFVISGFTLARSDHDIHSCISVWYNAHYVLWVLPTSYYKDSIYGFRIIRCVICFETHSPEPQASLVYVRAGFLPSLGPCSILGSTRIGASGESLGIILPLTKQSPSSFLNRFAPKELLLWIGVVGHKTPIKVIEWNTPPLLVIRSIYHLECTAVPVEKCSIYIGISIVKS